MPCITGGPEKEIPYLGEVTDYSRGHLGGCATDEFFERMQFTRRDLKALEQVAWSLASQDPPLGPAMRDAISAIRMVLDELNAAMHRALPLGDEDAEGSTPAPLPDIDLPETEVSRAMPLNVDYAGLIEK